MHKLFDCEVHGQYLIMIGCMACCCVHARVCVASVERSWSTSLGTDPLYIVHHPSPITHRPSPITHRPSPITHHPLPTAFDPTANFSEVPGALAPGVTFHRFGILGQTSQDGTIISFTVRPRATTHAARPTTHDLWPNSYALRPPTVLPVHHLQPPHQPLLPTAPPGTNSVEYSKVRTRELFPLSDIMRMLGHTNQRIAVLNLDCEGAEWGVIDQQVTLNPTSTQPIPPRPSSSLLLPPAFHNPISRSARGG